jgi:2-C-methyl-D-erythritol 2,4-cyclodiphosphate synthase
MKAAIGQDSHKFDFNDKEKKLILGGVIFENHAPLAGNSDADVVLHSIANAVSGITCVNILGEIADNLCKSRHNRQQNLLVGSIEISAKQNHTYINLNRMPNTKNHS